MVLKGSLGTFDIISVIQMITSQQATGIIHIKDTGEKDAFDILIDSGRLVRIIPIPGTSKNPTRNPAVKYIAERLSKAGLLESGQLKVLLDAVKKEGLTEYDIPNRFSVSLSLVKKLIMTITYESLHTMHHLKKGFYEFESKAIDYDSQFCEPMNTDFVLMESSRVVDEVSHLNRIYGDEIVLKKTAVEEPVQPAPVPPEEKSSEETEDFVIEKSSTPVETTQQEQPTSEKHRSPQDIILELINGKNTLTAIYYSSLLSKNEVILELSNMLGTGKIVILSETRGPFKPAKGSIYTKLFNAVRSVSMFILTIVILSLVLYSSRINTPINTLLNPFRHAAQKGNITYTNLLKYIGRYQQIKLSNALEIYKLEYGLYPASLKTLVDMHIISSNDLTFPYGSEYYYTIEGEGYILLAPKYAAR